MRLLSTFSVLIGIEAIVMDRFMVERSPPPFAFLFSESVDPGFESEFTLSDEARARSLSLFLMNNFGLPYWT
jgi:hypothetical protein